MLGATGKSENVVLASGKVGGGVASLGGGGGAESLSVVSNGEDSGRLPQ